MHVISETHSDGVSQRLFTAGDVTGALWTPDGAVGPRPLILLGHGGGQHKTAPGMVGRALLFANSGGYAVAAIDAPGHGDRPRTSRDEELVADLRNQMATGGDASPALARMHAELAPRAVADWRATLDTLQNLDEVGAAGPVGYLGLSLGAALGIPFIANEPRICAAVLGLVGQETVGVSAPRVTMPIEFLLQWDDELVSRDSALALFDALGSTEKTLHANLGSHADVPRFETQSALQFFARHFQASLL